MKILHITASMDPKLGGVCQAVKSIVKGLNDYAETKNEILSFDYPDAVFIKQNPCFVHALGPGKGPLLYNQNYVSWLFANLDNYDVIVLHGLWTYQGFGLIKALKKIKWTNETGKIKFFVMPHGMLDPYFQKARGRKLKAIRNWIYWKLIEKNVANLASGLLFTCEAEMDLAKDTFYPYHPKSRHIVGLGVEEPPKQSSSITDALVNLMPKDTHQTFLLYLSRIHEKKGTDLLIQSFNKLAITQSDASFTALKKGIKLIIAGPGIETTFGQKVKILAEGSHEEQIAFPGMLSGDKKWAAFYHCSAFVLISHQENFGIAVVEALACGKPVLISDQINIWKEIADSNAGIICTDDQAGADELLGKWYSLSDFEKKEMSKNARLCYEKHFFDGKSCPKVFYCIISLNQKNIWHSIKQQLQKYTIVKHKRLQLYLLTMLINSDFAIQHRLFINNLTYFSF